MGAAQTAHGTIVSDGEPLRPDAGPDREWRPSVRLAAMTDGAVGKDSGRLWPEHHGHPCRLDRDRVKGTHCEGRDPTHVRDPPLEFLPGARQRDAVHRSFGGTLLLGDGED